MTTLHLGIIDAPYAYDRSAGRRRGKRRAASRSTTTGEVAEILEAKYHVYEVFFEETKDEIAGYLTEALAGAVESMVMGAPQNMDPFVSAAELIDERFRTFLSTREIESIGIPGVPTEAAMRGVSHRFAHPYARRDPRPSFIDTGLYMTSFRSWLD